MPETGSSEAQRWSDRTDRAQRGLSYRQNSADRRGSIAPGRLEWPVRPIRYAIIQAGRDMSSRPKRLVPFRVP